MRILVIDDDPKFRSYVSRGLSESGIDSADAADAADAVALLEGPEGFDLILLDVMMPVRSGWDLLAELRSRGKETPVIFVTARDAVEERVRGLRLGADDYVIKPFAFNELLARIGAVLRRRSELAPVRYADLEMDLGRRRAQRSGRNLDLSPKEFELLWALVVRRGAVASRAELLREVWAIDFDPGTNLVDVHVARLRRKLERFGPHLIATVRSVGYRLTSAGPGGG